MASKGYTIEKTAPTVYLDNRGNAVQGYLVFVNLTAYNESHELRLPSLDSKVVEKAADKLLADRDALANIGG